MLRVHGPCTAALVACGTTPLQSDDLESHFPLHKDAHEARHKQTWVGRRPPSANRLPKRTPPQQTQGLVACRDPPLLTPERPNNSYAICKNVRLLNTEAQWRGFCPAESVWAKIEGSDLSSSRHWIVLSRSLQRTVFRSSVKGPPRGCAANMGRASQTEGSGCGERWMGAQVNGSGCGGSVWQCMYVRCALSSPTSAAGPPGRARAAGFGIGGGALWARRGARLAVGTNFEVPMGGGWLLSVPAGSVPVCADVGGGGGVLGAKESSGSGLVGQGVGGS